MLYNPVFIDIKFFFIALRAYVLFLYCYLMFLCAILGCDTSPGIYDTKIVLYNVY